MLKRPGDSGLVVGSLLHPLARTSAALVLLQGVGLVCGYALHYLLARHLLDVEQYGIYSWATSLALVLASAATLGTPNTLLRFLPRYRDEGDRLRLRGLLSLTVFAVAAAAAVIAGAIAAAAWLFPSVAAALPPAFLVLLPGLPLIALTLQIQSILRSFDRPLLGHLPNQILRPAAVALASLVAIVGVGTLNAFHVATIFGLVNLAIAVIFLIPLFLAVRPLAFSSIPSDTRRYWISESGPYALSMMLTLLMNRIDIVIVGLLLPPREVALYSVGFRTASLLSFPLIAVNAVFAPRIATLHARNDRPGLQSEVLRASVLMALATGLFGGVIMLLTPWILGIFGPSYRAAASLVIVLCLGRLFNAAAGPVVNVLNLTGHQRSVLRTFLWAAPCGPLLTVALVKWIGLIGAAVAATAVFVLWSVALHRAVSTQLGITASSAIFLLKRPGRPDRGSSETS